MQAYYQPDSPQSRQTGFEVNPGQGEAQSVRKIMCSLSANSWNSKHTSIFNENEQTVRKKSLPRKNNQNINS